MTDFIINALAAANKSQEVNRNNWLAAAGRKLSDRIMRQAATGQRSLSVKFSDLLIGAENLGEAGEMFMFLSKELNRQHYKHEITIDGTLIISW
jgi:hypothetical protein